MAGNVSKQMTQSIQMASINYEQITNGWQTASKQFFAQLQHISKHIVLFVLQLHDCTLQHHLLPLIFEIAVGVMRCEIAVGVKRCVNLEVSM